MGHPSFFPLVRPMLRTGFDWTKPPCSGNCQFPAHNRWLFGKRARSSRCKGQKVSAPSWS